MIALYHRASTGQGQHVDVSIQESVLQSTFFVAEVWDILGMNFPRLGEIMPLPRENLPPLLLRTNWPCKDGEISWQLAGGAWAGGVASTKALVEMANRDGMALELKDYDWSIIDFSTVPQEEYDRVGAIFRQYFSTKTKAELFEEAMKRGVILCPVSDSKDLVENPQLAHREFWVKVEHPELGEAITYPGAFAKLSEAPWRVWRRPPLIGEHNEEVYVGELGLSKETLVELRQAGVI